MTNDPDPHRHGSGFQLSQLVADWYDREMGAIEDEFDGHGIEIDDDGGLTISDGATMGDLDDIDMHAVQRHLGAARAYQDILKVIGPPESGPTTGDADD